MSFFYKKNPNFTQKYSDSSTHRVANADDEDDNYDTADEDFESDDDEFELANENLDFSKDFKYNFKTDFWNEFIKDFVNYKDNLNKSEKWATPAYSDWDNNKLSESEREALQSYAGNDYVEINNYLRLTNGELITDISKRPSNLTKNEVESLNKKIKLINSALEKTALEQKMIVYRVTNERQFNIPLGSLLTKDGVPIENGKINHEVAKQIASNFVNEIFHQHSYMSTSIAKILGSHFNLATYPILMQFTLPKGIRAAFLGDSISKFKNTELELLIRQGYKWRYDNFIVTKERGRECLKAYVSLVRSSKYQKFNYSLPVFS